MNKFLSMILVASMVSPAYASEIEERGGVKIPSKAEIKATKRYQEIQDWKTVKTKQGYILSNDLYYVQKCSPTWDIHVKAFQKENPNVKNPNVLSIGQIIKVQTCFAEEKVVQEVVKEEAPVQKEEVKKEEKKEFFVLASGQFNKSADGDGNKASQGAGIKLEAGKYFKLSEDRKIKASIGVLMNKTSIDSSNEETKKTTTTADVSYLLKVNEKMSIGPNLELMAGQGFKDHVNSRNDKLSGFGGVNLDYSLNDRLSLDLKVLNALEGRLNLNTSFGLGINF